MTTDMRYTVNIDAQQANAELMKLRSEVVTLAGQEQAMAKATDAATAALVKHGDAAAKATPKVETLQQRAAKLPDILGKQAAAISLVSSSLEGMGGEVGKAVAGAGQLAAAYGAGGPFALALVGGIGIIDKLTEYWKSLNEEEERNIKLKYAGVDAAKTEEQRLSALLVELRRQADPAKAEADDQAKRIAAADLLEKQMKGKFVAAMQYGVSEENARIMETEANLMRNQLVLLREEVTLRETIKNNREKPPAPPSTPPPPASTPRKPKAAAEAAADTQPAMGDWSLLDPLTSMRVAQEEHLTKVREEEAAKRAEIDAKEKQGAKELAAFKAYVDEQSENAKKKRLADELAETEKTNNLIVGIAQQSAGLIAGASQQLVADLIGHQDKALERFGINIMAQAGQALVSYGTQAIGAGTLSALTGNIPLGALQVAGGVGLITAGVGLGGAAAGISSLMGAESGGAARGASPRTSTGNSGAQAGPTQITYIFAPSRDEGAAAVAIAGRTADSRQLNKTRTR